MPPGRTANARGPVAATVRRVSPHTAVAGAGAYNTFARTVALLLPLRSHRSTRSPQVGAAAASRSAAEAPHHPRQPGGVWSLAGAGEARRLAGARVPG